jgi:uncharacterized protein (TIGR03382 family)
MRVNRRWQRVWTLGFVLAPCAAAGTARAQAPEAAIICEDGEARLVGTDADWVYVSTDEGVVVVYADDEARQSANENAVRCRDEDGGSVLGSAATVGIDDPRQPNAADPCSVEEAGPLAQDLELVLAMNLDEFCDWFPGDRAVVFPAPRANVPDVLNVEELIPEMELDPYAPPPEALDPAEAVPTFEWAAASRSIGARGIADDALPAALERAGLYGCDASGEGSGGGGGWQWALFGLLGLVARRRIGGAR